ncbi:MAG TPA: NADH-ubiquinone oxidoreductase-F iron-sulfur binding region domain-containing protein [Gaiellaceae bacterium]|nr:NADH-ubiquinone oxidoreductase-F iron-sulfur binding region domain-containing protein [Gaiellaceae bacterium]
MSVSVKRLLLGLRPDGRAVTLDEHLHLHGPLPGRLDRRSLLDVVEQSGLAGRGGAGFPTAAKLRAVAGGRGRKFVLANGVEGEPPSGKDKVLIRYVPHLVLDGVEVAAAAVGADQAVVAVSRAATEELAALRHALRERRPSDHVEIRIAAVPDTFVAGEETALVNAVAGGPPSPTETPPRPFERGIGGRPTLVQNVETLAQVALIARRGAAWFREAGTPEEPGSALFTVSGAVRLPGVYEVPLGTSLPDLVAEAGGLAQPPRAVLVGGFFGSWLDAATASTCDLSEASLGSAGAMLGARAVVVLPEGSCALAEVARVSRFLADESAGQCGPCVHGLDAIAGAVASLARSNGVDDEFRIRRWLEQVDGRGGCRHPDGAARFIRSALDVFAEEVALHRSGKSCPGRDLHLLPAQRASERRAA